MQGTQAKAKATSQKHTDIERTFESCYSTVSLQAPKTRWPLMLFHPTSSDASRSKKG
jgi:hypothetical protein